ncbi:ribbon-helix-helix domain-containing protein [Azospirillum isscasi]|uniref:Ribbon-helix-helix domain-containing protein n=1 Tax=Azospirillum isscasi TaxID=3053926 RepID=A0ABU0WDH9_9PROT|nr:ribbon-helix-helix domain-containing protein [Azospirillum isscasi]MDQ2102152.1 ribbon-helix-helix domain-containing protein [Azospirillum isscasi]
MSAALEAAFEAVDLIVSPTTVRTIDRANGQRSSMKLEEEWWAALGDVCQREGFDNRRALVAAVDARGVRLGLQRLRARHLRTGVRSGGSWATLAGAVRVFVVTYYRTAALHNAATAATVMRDGMTAHASPTGSSMVPQPGS